MNKPYRMISDLVLGVYNEAVEHRVEKKEKPFTKYEDSAIDAVVSFLEKLELEGRDTVLIIHELDKKNSDLRQAFARLIEIK